MEGPSPACLRRESQADFIEMAQKVSRILVDTVGAGPFEFLTAVASRQQADSERPGPSGSQHVPDTVTDDETVVDWHVEALSRSDKEVRIRLGMSDLVAGDDRHAWAEFQELERVARTLQASARRNRVRHLVRRQAVQQLLSARKNAKGLCLAFIRFSVQALDTVGLVLRHRMSDLTKKSVCHQAATHADLPVNTPDREVNPFGLEGFVPGQHMLVDAIHQGAIQIKQEGEAIVRHYESMNNSSG
jgi:hypothetical protein